MATNREKMESARAYIKVKDYESARKLLKQVDHPKAKEWLKKLPPPKRNYLRWVLVALVIIGIVFASFQMIEMRRQADAINHMVEEKFGN